MIFRILCGEWIEPLWDCMRANEKDVSCSPPRSLPRLIWAARRCCVAGSRAMFFDFPAGAGDGQLHGAQPLLGLVAQQLQLGGAEK